MTVEFIEDLKKQWMAMIDAISDPLALVDSEFTILRQNRAYAEAARNAEGLKMTDFKGKKCYEVFANRKSPCDHCQLPLVKKENKQPHWTTDSMFPERVTEVTINQFQPESESSQEAEMLYVLHYRDVTDQRALQESLAQNDKLAALGKLAGGIAHEINSPLAGILAFSQMVLRELDDNNPHKQDLLEIESAARKCKVIVEGVLGFARQDRPSEETLNLSECVKSTLRLAAPLISKHGITLKVDFDEAQNGVVRGSPGKLGQVFLNLITNAIYAMKDEGGMLQIQGEIEDEKIWVYVRDSGPGIDPQVLGKIFDPFFTTKPIGEGTGLGLSISYSIIKQHGGKISVQSTPGIGTTFTVELPIIEGASAGEIND